MPTINVPAHVETSTQCPVIRLTVQVAANDVAKLATTIVAGYNKKNSVCLLRIEEYLYEIDFITVFNMIFNCILNRIE